MTGQIEIQLLRPQHVEKLSRFFAEIAADAVGVRFFHPHPFSQEWAERICGYQGSDLYFGLLHQDQVVGYGMLRGWDEGHEVPSLGIYLAARMRGTGAAHLLMHHLHMAAALNGARQIRLKVYPDNSRARFLYERMGYTFTQSEGQYMVGVATIEHP